MTKHGPIKQVDGHHDAAHGSHIAHNHHQTSYPRPVMSFFGAGASTTASTAADKDVEVAELPPDSISSLSFSPSADYLSVGSWDNSVRTRDRLCGGDNILTGISRFVSMK